MSNVATKEAPKEVPLSKRDQMQARVMACYCAQIIEDSCNSDLSRDGLEGVSMSDLVMAGELQAFYENISGVLVE